MGQVGLESVGSGGFLGILGGVVRNVSRFVPRFGVGCRFAGGGGTGECGFGRTFGHEDGAAVHVFAAALTDDFEDLVDGKVLRLVLIEFVLPFLDAGGELFHVLFQGAAQFGFGIFPEEAAQALDLGSQFGFPTAQGGFGDVELFGDVTQAVAPGAEFYELVFEV